MDDEATPNPNSTLWSSKSVAGFLYLFLGYGVYFTTRLMYDYEWDRYFHIYYPASMEYFDVFSKYYLIKYDNFVERLPKMMQLTRPKTMPIDRRELHGKWQPQFIHEETTVANEFIKVFDKQDKQNEYLKDLIKQLD